MNHGLYTVINLTLIPQTLLLSAHTHIVDGRQPCVAHRCVSAFNAGAANLTDTGYALTHSPPRIQTCKRWNVVVMSASFRHHHRHSKCSSVTINFTSRHECYRRREWQYHLSFMVSARCSHTHITQCTYYFHDPDRALNISPLIYSYSCLLFAAAADAVNTVLVDDDNAPCFVVAGLWISAHTIIIVCK